MESELLTTDELALRIKYDVRTIRERLKDTRQDGSVIDRLLASRLASGSVQTAAPPRTTPPKGAEDSTPEPVAPCAQ